jgi:UDP-N-acetylglucosamine 2-epimerase
VKILSIVGARPQFVKVAMMAEAITNQNEKAETGPHLEHVLVHTGQHYDPNLSDVFFSQLPLPEPHYNLGVGSGSHAQQTGELMKRIEHVLLKERPDVVVLYGDTNSTIAGALAASKLHIKLAHVEAGLRSFNRRMPEEINRVVADHLSDLLFCPTQTAINHLKNEGITKGVYLSGDVMLDAVLAFTAIANTRSRVLSTLSVAPSEYMVCTMHRAENTDGDQHIAKIVQLLTQIGRPVVFPMHPRTRDRLASSSQLREPAKSLFSTKYLYVINPVSYLDMLALTSNARLVLTDSGGLQKEAYFLGVPCLTLRGETEWTETLNNGWNRLVNAEPEQTIPLVESLWNGNGMRPLGRPNLAAFGGGQAAEFIVQQLASQN